MKRRVQAIATLHGTVRVPGDKSASHRSLMLSALAAGESTIEGLSAGHDVASTSRIVLQLGAKRRDESGVVVLTGPPDGLRASTEPLDCGNSGTTMRLLSGIVSAVEGTHVLVGDASLSRRPMDRVAIPLGFMGASVEGHGARVTAPLVVKGARHLNAIKYQVPTPSAQVKSAILFAGLNAVGETTVHEEIRTRTSTEDMMRSAGIELRTTDERQGRTVSISAGRPQNRTWRVPGDPSQAAFFCVLGLIHPHADIEVVDVEDSPERIGFLHVLSRMGARLETRSSHVGASLHARSSQLCATEIRAHEIPSVDEVPVLTVAACAATGVSVFRDMGELRLKESDRFAGSIDLARRIGCSAWSEGDDFFVEGLGSATRFSDFEIDAGLDHRIVMSSAVAGIAGRGCDIGGAETVNSSYPKFFDDVRDLQ